MVALVFTERALEFEVLRVKTHVLPHGVGVDGFIATGLAGRDAPIVLTDVQNHHAVEYKAMVNNTELIRALTLSSLSNNTKRWLSAYLKKRTTSYRYNFTPLPLFMPG